MVLAMYPNNTTLPNTGSKIITGSIGFGMLVEFFCLWTFCGNIIIIIILTLYKPLTIPDILVFSLALSDLLNVLFPAQMLNIIPNLLQRPWNRPLCVLFTWSAYWLRISSVLTISVISIDRLIAVQKPLVYRSRVMDEIGRVKILLIALWLLSSFIASLPYIGFGHTGYHDGQCNYQLTNLGLAYGILLEIIGLAQLVLVLYCYIAIKVSTGNFMKRQDNFRKLHLDRTVSSNTTSNMEASSGNKNTMRRQNSTMALTGDTAQEIKVSSSGRTKWSRRFFSAKLKETKKDPLTVGMRQVAKMEKLMASLVLLFYLSWLPFLLSNLMSLITRKTDETMIKIVGICSLINGLINPILYATIYPRYKKGYAFVFGTLLSWCGGAKPTTTIADFDALKRSKSRKLQTLREAKSIASISSDENTGVTKSIRGWSHTSSCHTETIHEEEIKLQKLGNTPTKEKAGSPSRIVSDIIQTMASDKTSSDGREVNGDLTDTMQDSNLPGESIPGQRFISADVESNNEQRDNEIQRKKIDVATPPIIGEQNLGFTEM